MVRNAWFRTAAVAAMVAATDAALAQPQPQIEIDFVNAQVPLSPMLTVAIAAALMLGGFFVLRRRRLGGRLWGWLLLALGAASALSIAQRADWAPQAWAGVLPTINLTTSPATLSISSPGTYTAQNTSGGPIVLTQVKLNNPDGFIIGVGTTCTPGIQMPPSATCVVVINGD